MVLSLTLIIAGLAASYLGLARLPILAPLGIVAFLAGVLLLTTPGFFTG